MTVNVVAIITFNSFHLINADDAVNNIVVVVFLHRLSQSTKAQSNLSRIMSADCNRRIDRCVATFFSARCVAVDAKHILPVYVAADYFRCWLFHAESLIFRSSRYNIVDGCGWHNI